MHPQLHSLLQRCAAAPADEDFPWLVAADWLDEQGDPRGWAVRELRRRPVTLPVDARAAAGALGPAVGAGVDGRGWLHHDADADAPPSPADWPAIVRLTFDPSADADKTVARLTDLTEGGLRRLRLRVAWSDLSPRVWDALTRLPALEGLDLYENQGNAEYSLRPLKRLSGLRYLGLFGLTSFGEADADAVAALPGLERLALGGMNDLETPGWSRLAALRRLRQLELYSLAGPTPAHVEEWAAAFPLRSLTAWVTPIGWAAPLVALPTLADLTLRNVAEPSAELRHRIAGARGLERVELGGLSDQLTAEFLSPLACLPRLRSATLSGMPADAGPPVMRALADAPELVELDLSLGTRFLKSHAAAAVRLTRLRSLRFREATHLGPKRLAKLRAALPGCEIHGEGGGDE